MYAILIAVGLIAGFLSGSVGFGGGMILLPVVTYFFGVEVAVPLSTIAQLMSNLSKVGMGWKQIEWKQVGWFLLPALPFTALGAFGFAVVNKALMTRILCVALIVFAVMKLVGKVYLPKSKATMLVGGGLTGFVNGMLGIGGPLSSAVFFSLELSPVSYIASEATASAAMHIVKTVMYGRLNLMSGEIFLNGFLIGCAMVAGNFIAIKLIKHINRKPYRYIVASVMIIASVWLFVTV